MAINSIMHLPEEILIKVFSYLDAEDLLEAGSVCRSWRQLTGSDVLWRTICCNRWRLWDHPWVPNPHEARPLEEGQRAGGGHGGVEEAEAGSGVVMAEGREGGEGGEHAVGEEDNAEMSWRDVCKKRLRLEAEAKFLVREMAWPLRRPGCLRRLAEMGTLVVEVLDRLQSNTDPLGLGFRFFGNEAQHRIHTATCIAGMRKILSGPPSELEDKLARGALIIAKLRYRELDMDAIDSRLDDVAAILRRRLETNAEVARQGGMATPRGMLAALCELNALLFAPLDQQQQGAQRGEGGDDGKGSPDGGIRVSAWDNPGTRVHARDEERGKGFAEGSRGAAEGRDGEEGRGQYPGGGPEGPDPEGPLEGGDMDEECLRLRGNRGDYYNPRNLYLNDVLESRLGIPISLAVIHSAVGRRCGIPVQMVGIPMHFLNKVGAEGSPAERFVDVFNGGALMVRDDVQQLIASMGLDYDPRMLDPVSPTSVLVRMCNNLIAIYRQREADREGPARQREAELRLLPLLDLLISIAPTDISEHLFKRAKMHLQTPDFEAALEDLQALLDLTEAPSQGSEDTTRTTLLHFRQRALEMQRQHERWCNEVRAPKPADVQFLVGSIIRHAKWGYRGVIFGWEARCTADDEWIKAMQVDNLRQGRNQPYYRVLVDQSDRRSPNTYVAQENLALAVNAGPINNDELGEHFLGHRSGRYVPNAYLRFLYPEDVDPNDAAGFDDAPGGAGGGGRGGFGRGSGPSGGGSGGGWGASSGGESKPRASWRGPSPGGSTSGAGTAAVSHPTAPVTGSVPASDAHVATAPSATWAALGKQVLQLSVGMEGETSGASQPGEETPGSRHSFGGWAVQDWDVVGGGGLQGETKEALQVEQEETENGGGSGSAAEPVGLDTSDEQEAPLVAPWERLMPATQVAP